jgi:hypothetical protein
MGKITDGDAYDLYTCDCGRSHQLPKPWSLFRHHIVCGCGVEIFLYREVHNADNPQVVKDSFEVTQ